MNNDSYSTLDWRLYSFICINSACDNCLNWSLFSPITAESARQRLQKSETISNLIVNKNVDLSILQSYTHEIFINYWVISVSPEFVCGGGGGEVVGEISFDLS
jgi:hypothetical protein